VTATRALLFDKNGNTVDRLRHLHPLVNNRTRTT
jgi:hypothetical protein